MRQGEGSDTEPCDAASNGARPRMTTHTLTPTPRLTFTRTSTVSAVQAPPHSAAATAPLPFCPADRSAALPTPAPTPDRSPQQTPTQLASNSPPPPPPIPPPPLAALRDAGMQQTQLACHHHPRVLAFRIDPHLPPNAHGSAPAHTQAHAFSFVRLPHTCHVPTPLTLASPFRFSLPFRITPPPPHLAMDLHISNHEPNRRPHDKHRPSNQPAHKSVSPPPNPCHFLSVFVFSSPQPHARSLEGSPMTPRTTPTADATQSKHAHSKHPKPTTATQTSVCHSTVRTCASCYLEWHSICHSMNAMNLDLVCHVLPVPVPPPIIHSDHTRQRAQR